MIDCRATAELYWLLQGDKPATEPAAEVPASEMGLATSGLCEGVAPNADSAAAGAGTHTDDDLDFI